MLVLILQLKKMVRASLKFCGNLNTLYGTVFLNKATFATKHFSIFARQSLEKPLFKRQRTNILQMR